MLGALLACAGPRGDQTIKAPSRRILFVLIGLLLGTGAWLLWRDAGEADWVDLAYEASPDSLPMASELRAEEDPVVLAEAAGRGAPPTGSQAARQRLGSGEVELPVAAGAGFAVRVVDGRDGRPLAGAVLRFFDPMMPQYRAFRRARREYRHDREAVLQRYGQMVRSGPDGVAWLPCGIPQQRATGRLGQLYGEAAVSLQKGAPAAGYVLRLYPDQSLRVQVLGADGEPARGFELCFYLPLNSGLGKPRWICLPGERRRDSAEAVQEFRHVQVGLQELQRNPAHAGLDRIQLGVRIPGASTCGPVLELKDFPIRELVQVRLPELCSLTVRVRDQEGHPVPRRVRIQAPADYPDQSLGPAELRRLAPRWDLDTDAEGQLRVPAVACGTRLEVASLGQRVDAGERAVLDTGDEAGAELEVELVKRIEHGHLLVAAVDARLQPLADTELEFQVLTKAGDEELAHLRRGRIRSDARGRLQLRLPVTRKGPAPRSGPGKAPAAPPRFNVYHELRLRYRRADGLYVRGVAALPGVLESGEEWRREVQLRAPPLLVAGRVYLDDEPLEDFDRFVVDQRDASKRKRYQRRSDAQVLAGPGNRFSVYGEPHEGQLRLIARSWGFLPVVPVEFLPGQTGVEIRLYRAGRLRVAVLHDETVKDAPLELMLRVLQVPGAELNHYVKWRFLGRLDRRNSGNLSYRRVYAWTGLPPGDYRLELRLQGNPQPFAQLEHLRIEARQGKELETAHVFNLMGQLKGIRLEVQDPRGRSIAALIQPLRQEGGEAEELISVERKQGGRIYTNLDHVDLRVLARGYRPQLLYGVRSDRVVRMQPGIPVDVHLPQLRVPRGVGVEVRLRKRLRSARRFRVGLRHPVVARAGTRRLEELVGETRVNLRHRGRRHYRGTLMLPGDFVVDVFLTRKNHAPVALRGFGPRLLKVRDVSSVHRLSVRTPQRRIHQVLAQLGLEVPAAEPRRREAPAKKK